MEDNDHFIQTKGKRLKDYILTGQSEEVLEEVNRLIELYPDKVGLLYYMLAEHYYLKSDSENKFIYKAIGIFEKLIGLKQADMRYVTLAIINLGFAFQSINEKEKALKYFDRALNEFPELFDNNSELRQKILDSYNELKKGFKETDSPGN